MKDTYLLLTKFPNTIFTPTVIKNAVSTTVVMVILFILFNLFSLINLNLLLDENLDSRIRHEIEHLYYSFEYFDNELHIINPNELKETDLATISEDPFFLQVYDLQGNILLQSKNLEFYKSIPIKFPNKFSGFYFEDIDLAEDKLRTGYFNIYDEKGNHQAYIQLSSFKKGFYKLTKNMFYFNLTIFPIVLIVIIVISIFLAKKSFTKINKIINLAKEITTENLNRRLTYDAKPNDELGKLKDTLNTLFERLEKQVDQITHFTDNASHQLMTPLTSVKSELDFLIKKDRSIGEYKEASIILLEQTQRMITIVKTLLLLAKDCEVCSDNKSVFNLSKIVKDELESGFRRNSRIVANIDENIYVKGNHEYFSMVINNLIDNALKYSDKTENVDLLILSESKFVKIIVTDLGIGIPDSEKSLIFDRFYRSKKANKSTIGGYGLGLSLVISIVKSMNGTIEVSNNIPNGTVFTIKLPKVEFIN